MKTSLFRLFTAVSVLLVLFMLAVPLPSYSSPVAALSRGTTSVGLGAEFLSAIENIKVSAFALRPSKVIRKSSLTLPTVTFPIVSGRIDAADLRGEIAHSGGLRLVSSSAQVDLSNFTIDTTSGAHISGLVVVDGSLAGRIRLFDLQLPPQTLPQTGRDLKISGIGVRLSSEAALSLNQIFGTGVFQAGMNIGTASVATTLVVLR